jgi:hypothetical protein
MPARCQAEHDEPIGIVLEPAGGAADINLVTIKLFSADRH